MVLPLRANGMLGHSLFAELKENPSGPYRMFH